MEHVESRRKMHLPSRFLIFLVYGAGARVDTLNSLAVSFVASVIRLTSNGASSTFLVRPGRSLHESVHRTQTHRTRAGYLTIPSFELKLAEDCCKDLGLRMLLRIG